jgi:hypothetical protein
MCGSDMRINSRARQTPLVRLRVPYPCQMRGIRHKGIVAQTLNLYVYRYVLR